MIYKIWLSELVYDEAVQRYEYLNFALFHFTSHSPQKVKIVINMVTRVNNGLDFGIPILNMVNCTTTGAKNDPKSPVLRIQPWVNLL